MSVEINIHLTHRQYTDNQKSVEVKGKTVGEALVDLCKKYPKIESELFDAKGELLKYIEIYLNAESTYPDELKKSIKHGDKLQITAILSGG
jgi:molybdopterin converting factor small subunit